MNGVAVERTKPCSLAIGVLCAIGVALSGQNPTGLRAGSIEVKLIGAHVNPDDDHDLMVSVLVTIRAADQTLVIPTCADDIARSAFFCVAGIVGANGKSIGVRKGLAASLGVEPEDRWQAISIAPGTQRTFTFTYSTRLMDVRAGQPLRIWFDVWPSPESMKEQKSSAHLLSPVFRNPSKAD